MGNVHRIKSYEYLKAGGLNPIFVCHNTEQADRLRSAFSVADIVSLDIPVPEPGVNGFDRDICEQVLFDMDDWYVSVDDNITHLSGLDPELYKLSSLEPDPRFRAEFERVIDPKRLPSIFDEMIDNAESAGTSYAAFTKAKNYYFRLGKWQSVGFACNAFCLKKRIGSPWYSRHFKCIADMAQSVMTVARTGACLVNRFARMEKTYHESGGIGSAEIRLPYRYATLNFLLDHFYGLIVEDTSELGIRFSRVKHWRSHTNVNEVLRKVDHACREA